MCNEIYPELRNKDGSLKHSTECRMMFGRKDAKCPRCIEMLNGSPARDGWQKDHYVTRKMEEEARLRSIKEHDCKKSGCAYICTAFDN